MVNKNNLKSGNSNRWLVFFIISVIYFFVYFHRVSTSVIAQDILKAFNVNATALGFMSSMYFYLYAFEQPLVGYFTDKLGARRVIAYCTLAAAAGCFMFALAPGIGWASAGRALIGIGVGGVYVPAVKAFSQWFERNEFATMIGLLMAVGNFGAIVATTPLAWAANNWGWRISFHIIGWISLALAIGAFFLIKDFNGSGTTVEDEQYFRTGRNRFKGNSFLQGSHLFSILDHSSYFFWCIRNCDNFPGSLGNALPYGCS